MARTLFPLGELHKTEVRQLGRDYGLINAEREESREICFVPDDNYARLVQARFPQLAQPGTIRDAGGNAVGTHEGYFHYTIGQRKKIQIATTEKRYVTSIIPEKNEIVVGSDDDLLTDTFQVTDVNWVAIDPTQNPPSGSCRMGHPALIKIRYLHKPIAGDLQVLPDGSVKVHLSQKQRAVTPGQSCVFYDGDVVLGGGKIV